MLPLMNLVLAPLLFWALTTMKPMPNSRSVVTMFWPGLMGIMFMAVLIPVVQLGTNAISSGLAPMTSARRFLLLRRFSFQVSGPAITSPSPLMTLRRSWV